MTRILVCTAVYEGVRAFLPEYVNSLRAAAACAEARVEVLFAVDGLLEPGAALAALGTAVPHRFIDASGGSVAMVRKRLLHAAVTDGADLLVFADADDMMEQGGLAQHMEALKDADFSYGDQLPVDERGNSAGPPFFEGAGVPFRLDSAAPLARRNFVGFTASAVRRTRVPPEAMEFPSCVLAADWWFYTMLARAGRLGTRTRGPVVRYRLHSDNVLGPRPTPTLESMLRRCTIAMKHYAALPPDRETHASSLAIERLAQRLTAEPQAWTAAIARACAERGVWFDDVWRLASAFLPEPAEPADTRR